MAHAVIAYGLWQRLVIYGGMPVTLLMEGEDVERYRVPGADGTSVGDLWLGGRVRLLGGARSPFALAGQATLTVPMAELADDKQAYAGSRTVNGVIEALAEARVAAVRITGNLGVRVAPEATIGFAKTGHELQGGLGLTVDVNKSLALTAEGYGASDFNHFFAREASPLELLFGGKWFASESWTTGLAFGPGLTRGVGSPAYRAIAMVGFSSKPEPQLESPRDSDRDGVLDTVDACPLEPEDQDDFEDSDGCPDPDNDQDGVLDLDDGAPLEPEDKDGFEDDDGVPDPDNDRDGVLDAADKCPLEAEDKDGFEDDDGCPDLDNDKDTVLDAVDKCPNTPGEPHAQGCPSAARVKNNRIEITGTVEFAVNKDSILPESEPLLSEVVSSMRSTPPSTKFRVEGHTDDRGGKAMNLRLSKRRAVEVKRWLVEHGVEAERLGASGCGPTLAIGDNKTEEGRQANRRVEFHIIDSETEGFAAREGCTPGE